MQLFAPCEYQCLALSPRSPLVPPSVLSLLPGVNSGGWCVLNPDHYAEEWRGEVVGRGKEGREKERGGKRGEGVRREKGERRKGEKEEKGGREREGRYT